jgi:hypothetical protein
MASSGSINSSSYEGRYLQLSWTQTKDVANNRSTIKWTLSSIGGTEVYYSTGATTVKINGTQVYYKDRMDWTTYAFPAAKGSVSGTTTINHASDGTGSIKVELSTAIWYYAIDSYSKTWTLDTIPRASTPTLSASSVNIGSAVTINTNRASSAFTHTIRYEWAGTSGTIATGVGSSYSWTIPTSFASNIPNATSGTCKVYVDTYNGSTKIGTKSVNLTAKVPDADWTKPLINSVTISPSGNPDWVGSRYVQSKTKARVVTGTTGQAGATIKTCEVTIDGTKYTGTDITSNAIRNSGTVSATIKVTDSRGYTNSTTKNISVEAYSKPYIANHSTQSKIICARCNDNGTLVSNGTRLRLMLSKKWSALSGSTNTALVQYQINSNGWVTASAHTVATSDVALTVTNITLDLKQTYKVSIKITDKFGDTDTYQYDIPTEEVAFHLKEGGGGAAFGKYAEEDDLFEVAWRTRLKKHTSVEVSEFESFQIKRVGSGNAAVIRFANDNGKLGYIGMTNTADGGLIRWKNDTSANYLILDTGNTKDYIVEQGTSGVWRYRKWNSGFAECWGYHTISGTNIDVAWGSWYCSPVIALPSFPFTFVGAPDVHVGWESDFGAVIDGASKRESTKAGYVYLYRPVAQTNVNGRFSIYAYGKWK